MDLNDPDIIQFNLIPKRFLWVPQFILKAIKYINSHDFDICSSIQKSVSGPG